MTSVLSGPALNPQMVRELAISQRVCIRPLLRRVLDRETGNEDHVAIRCGSTLEAVCPPCARKAQVLRMHQCQEGWHRTDEPESTPPTESPSDELPQSEDEASDRQVRSTRRRQDAADLPRVPQEDRTVGRVFAAPDGREYRPSMFLTLTMPSYGPVTATGAPAEPGTYNYRRQALDTLHFARLVDRFWQNLRRCAGYRVQYFAAVEPQRRLAPHLHAAVRGAIPRQLLRQVVSATYLQIWWPPHDRPVYVQRTPVWDGQDYIDADTGEVLPTWQQALDRLSADPEARPSHVMRFGRQVDIAGIIAPSPDADRAVRYLTKYLTKSVADVVSDDELSPGCRRPTSTGCRTSCAGCRARSDARTGCATGSNPMPPDRGSRRAGAARRRTTATTWVWVAAGCWSRVSGRARRSEPIELIAPRSCEKPCWPPASWRPRPSAWPPT